MRVVVLGGGIAGESFVAALRRRSKDAEIVLVERELVGGECSYWACIPSKTLLRPVEVLSRARLTPGARRGASGRSIPRASSPGGTRSPSGTTRARWSGSRTSTPRSCAGTARSSSRASSASGRASFRTTISSSRPARAPPRRRSTGSKTFPTGRAATRRAQARFPRAWSCVGGGAVGCELAQFYARMGAKVTLVQSGADRCSTASTRRRARCSPSRSRRTAWTSAPRRGRPRSRPEAGG